MHIDRVVAGQIAIAPSAHASAGQDIVQVRPGCEAPDTVRGCAAGHALGRNFAEEHAHNPIGASECKFFPEPSENASETKNVIRAAFRLKRVRLHAQLYALGGTNRLVVCVI
eukprot:4381219-Alexandrium_andersonii.AAC.1